MWSGISRVESGNHKAQNPSPTPLEIPIKLLVFETPSPQENYNPFCGESMEISWNYTIEHALIECWGFMKIL